MVNDTKDSPYGGATEYVPQGVSKVTDSKFQDVPRLYAVNLSREGKSYPEGMGVEEMPLPWSSTAYTLRCTVGRFTILMLRVIITGWSLRGQSGETSTTVQRKVTVRSCSPGLSVGGM